MAKLEFSLTWNSHLELKCFNVVVYGNGSELKMLVSTRQITDKAALTAEKSALVSCLSALWHNPHVTIMTTKQTIDQLIDWYPRESNNDDLLWSVFLHSTFTFLTRIKSRCLQITGTSSLFLYLLEVVFPIQVYRLPEREPILAHWTSIIGSYELLFLCRNFPSIRKTIWDASVNVICPDDVTVPWLLKQKNTILEPAILAEKSDHWWKNITHEGNSS